MSQSRDTILIMEIDLGSYDKRKTMEEVGQKRKKSKDRRNDSEKCKVRQLFVCSSHNQAFFAT